MTSPSSKAPINQATHTKIGRDCALRSDDVAKFEGPDKKSGQGERIILAPSLTYGPITHVSTNSGCIQVTHEEAEVACKHKALKDIFFHLGGRIRKAISYAQDKEASKNDKLEVIDKMTKEQAKLLLDFRHSKF